MKRSHLSPQPDQFPYAPEPLAIETLPHSSDNPQLKHIEKEAKMENATSLLSSSIKAFPPQKRFPFGCGWKVFGGREIEVIRVGWPSQPHCESFRIVLSPVSRLTLLTSHTTLTANLPSPRGFWVGKVCPGLSFLLLFVPLFLGIFVPLGFGYILSEQLCGRKLEFFFVFRRSKDTRVTGEDESLSSRKNNTATNSNLRVAILNGKVITLIHNTQRTKSVCGVWRLKEMASRKMVHAV